MTGAVDWLDELQDPACYPDDAAGEVTVLQTHISVVCLLGERVYKLKKAVRLPFLDFSTKERRLRFCREEVRLNRRLCPDTYLGVVPLRRTGDGLRFGAVLADGAGPDPDVIDHAVLMRRLPEERMLDRLLQTGAVDREPIEALARLVARFHRGADRGPAVQQAGAPDRLRELALANFTELRGMPDHGLPAELLAALERRTAADFDRILPQLRQRAERGLVVDGHGDLHARNICLTEPPTIYDCIEFEPGFRCGDVATENAFLVMDLRYRGAGGLARAYVAAYAEASGDTDQGTLLPTLVSYRAMVRAKVAALTARDPDLSAADRDGAHASALRHLRLAAAAAAEAPPPTWILVCGPPASGKSSLCELLHRAAGWPHLSTDVVRKELAGVLPTQPLPAECYAPGWSDRTYAELLVRAQRAAAPVVLLDGNFATPARRAQAAAAARAAGARLWCALVDVDAATAQQRAAARQRAGGSTSDADAAVAARLRAAFVRPTAGEGLPLQTLAGQNHPDRMADLLLARLL